MSLLEFRQISKLFLPVGDGLKEINFALNVNDFLFLQGPSGAGKTTLLRLITQEYSADEGSIWFDDMEVGKLKAKNLEQHRRKIGVVYQDYKLIMELNVWENVALPLLIAGQKTDEVERRVTDLLDLVGLHNKALLFPKQLSGGEAQRVSIARALALSPKLIFADEPTGNLDAATAKNIAALLKKINKLGTAVMVATHDQNVLSLYPDSRLITIEVGRIVQDTRPAPIESDNKNNVDRDEHKARSKKSVKVDKKI